MNTEIKSGFITDLIVPPAGTCGKSAPDLEQIAMQTAMEILHDFIAFIHSNPLVTHTEQIFPGHDRWIDVPALCKDFNVELSPEYARGDWMQYQITDKLNVLWTTKDLIYYTAMRKTKTGFESVTDPGSGVKVHGAFDIQASHDAPGVIHYIERNETKCNVFLSVYIKATTGSSHRTMHENFKNKWNEMMKAKLS